MPMRHSSLHVLEPNESVPGVENLDQTEPMIYRGDYVDNKRHGRGRAIYSNGDVYEGAWVNNER
jgi:hypothetical protein